MKRLMLSLIALAMLGFAQDGRVEVNGIPIAYRSYGSAKHEAILLIAGTSMQLTAWPPELVGALVKKGYRVVAYDHRDVGLSGRAQTGSQYTVHDLAKDAIGLLDRLQIRKAHIVGASMGGMIAQIIASDWPDRTLSLTSLMATDGKPGLPLIAKPEAFAKVPSPVPGEDKAAYIERQIKVLEALGSPAYPTDEATLRKRATAAVERAYDPAADTRQATAAYLGAIEDRRPQLRTIKAPTVVVHGAEDPIVPVEAGRDVASNIPNAELRIIPGMGHEVPAALAPRIADAIAAAASRHKRGKNKSM
jgi:pimeloyl-ACP methyl ester carboxylesterase